MTIHHATLKKAKKLGIRMTEYQFDGGTVAIAGDDPIHHDTAREALAWAQIRVMLAAEYPAVTVEQSPIDTDATFDEYKPGISVAIQDYEETGEPKSEPVTIYMGDECPDLPDLLDLASDSGINPDPDCLRSTHDVGSIVGSRYKVAYAARGDASHCGDWFALWFANRYKYADGKSDIEALCALFEQNGLDLEGKWATVRFSERPGWQGRFRMSGGQMLRRVILRTGFVQLEDEQLPVDLDWALETLDKDQFSKVEPEWDMEAAMDAREAA